MGTLVGHKSKVKRSSLLLGVCAESRCLSLFSHRFVVHLSGSLSLFRTHCSLTGSLQIQNLSVVGAAEPRHLVSRISSAVVAQQSSASRGRGVRVQWWRGSAAPFEFEESEMEEFECTGGAAEPRHASPRISSAKRAGRWRQAGGDGDCTARRAKRRKEEQSREKTMPGKVAMAN